MNVGEWCKKKDCWNKVHGISIPLSLALHAELISKSAVKRDRDDAAGQAAEDAVINSVVEVFNLGQVGCWKRLDDCSTPPQEVAQRIDEARADFGNRRVASGTATYPPHVTLRTGALAVRPPCQSSSMRSPRSSDGGALSPCAPRACGRLRTWTVTGRNTCGLPRAQGRTACGAQRAPLRCTTWRASDRLHFEPHLRWPSTTWTSTGSENFASAGPDPRALPEGFEWTCDNIGLYRRDGDAWTPHQVWRM